MNITITINEELYNQLVLKAELVGINPVQYLEFLLKQEANKLKTKEPLSLDCDDFYLLEED